VATGFLLLIMMWDVFSAELMGNMRPVEFAKSANNWLCCSGVAEAGLDHIDGFVQKMKGKEIAGGGFDTGAFLAGEGCRQRTAILLAFPFLADLMPSSLCP
jgi:hypothetical protein